jgi:UDP-N-acetyl-D-mannosaminuronic acid dehydrogenase
LVSKKVPKDNIVVIGLGYVGLTLAAHFLKCGARVHGVEVRNEILDLLAQGEPGFHEPGLSQILRAGISSGNFTFSNEILEFQSRVVFVITVGTPLKNGSEPNMDNISNATNQVAAFLKDDDLVILRSTVKLGTTAKIVLPMLNRTGKIFKLAFCPERTLEGSALSEIEELPQIVGGISSESTRYAAKFFSSYSSKVVEVSNAETAELIKLTDNMQRDVTFAIANEVAFASIKHGIRAREVIQRGKEGYKRTNLAASGPVGGPCLEKDSWIFAKSFELNQEQNSLAIAARKRNLDVIAGGFSVIQQFVQDQKSVTPKFAILGLAFKGAPETDDTRGSSTLQLIERLRKEFVNSPIDVWDPLVQKFEWNDKHVNLKKDLAKTCLDANVIVLMNSHPALTQIEFDRVISKSVGPILIYDFWDRFEKSNFHPLVTYQAWGFHHE